MLGVQVADPEPVFPLKVSHRIIVILLLTSNPPIQLDIDYEAYGRAKVTQEKKAEP